MSLNRLDGEPYRRFLRFIVTVIGRFEREADKGARLIQLLSLAPVAWLEGGERIATTFTSRALLAEVGIQRLAAALEPERTVIVRAIRDDIDTLRGARRIELMARLAVADESLRDALVAEIWPTIADNLDPHSGALQVLADGGLVSPADTSSLRRRFRKVHHFVSLLGEGMDVELAEELADELQREAESHYPEVERELFTITRKLVRLGRVERAFALWKSTARFSFLGDGLEVL